MSMYYVNVFFIFALIGHVIENFAYTKVDSGILYGFWTPIYGIGVLAIILINNNISKLKLNKWFKPILLFFTCAISLALIESIAGYFIELVYGRIFWSYYNHFIPIGKYTSLQMMGIWGFASLALIYFMMPYIESFIKKTPKVITFLLISAFIIDLLYTFSKLADFKII